LTGGDPTKSSARTKEGFVRGGKEEGIAGADRALEPPNPKAASSPGNQGRKERVCHPLELQGKALFRGKKQAAKEKGGEVVEVFSRYREGNTRSALAKKKNARSVAGEKWEVRTRLTPGGEKERKILLWVRGCRAKGKTSADHREEKKVVV